MLMWDSVNPLKIPTTALAVAGYDDGRYAWTPTEWARFPQAKHVHIAVFPSTNSGMVIDCEKGDATPEQTVGWIEMRRAAKQFSPTVYTSFENWQAVIDAFDVAKVLHPMWWIADYDNIADVTKFELNGVIHGPLDTGVLAKQYQSTPGYDLSCTVANWPQ